MDLLMIYNEVNILPINISFHVLAFDIDSNILNNIQLGEQSFNVHLRSDCSLLKTQILDTITLPDITNDVGG